MNDYYIEQSKAYLSLCPLDRTGDYHVGKKCAGPLCMAWVQELNENGTPTRRGRCGRVHKHWWEAKEEEKSDE